MIRPDCCWATRRQSRGQRLRRSRRSPPSCPAIQRRYPVPVPDADQRSAASVPRAKEPFQEPTRVGLRSPGCTVRVCLPWVRWSHGPVIASRSSIERGIGCFCSVSCGGFRVVLFCQGCCRRRRLGVARPCPACWVWPARPGHRWVLEGGVVRMVTRGRLRAAVLLAWAGLALSAVWCAAPGVAAAARTGLPGPAVCPAPRQRGR